MKNFAFILSLAFLTSIVLFSCQKEEPTLDEQTKTETASDLNDTGEGGAAHRHPAHEDGHGNSGGGGGNDSEPIYLIEVDGDVISGQATYGISDGSNKKSDNLNAHICGSNLLFGIKNTAPLLTCFPNEQYCGIRNMSIKDKMKKPGVVQTLFLFQRYEGSSHTRFIMYGNIINEGENINEGGNSLFPTDVEDPVVVILDQFRIVLTSEECEVDDPTFIMDEFGNLEPSTMTITLTSYKDVNIACSNGFEVCEPPPL